MFPQGKLKQESGKRTVKTRFWNFVSLTISLLGRIEIFELGLFWLAKRYFEITSKKRIAQARDTRLEIYPDALDKLEIDVVYLWVDSSDPKWRAKFDQYAHKKRDGHSFNEARFQSSGELCSSINQLAKNADWIRKVFIVTDNQVPDCVQIERNDLPFEIQLVFHQNLIPEEKLPLFNTQSILAHVADIDDLSENFLFMNDDFFIARRVLKSDFVFPNGIHRYRYTTTLLESGPLGEDHVLYSSRMNSIRLAQSLHMQTSSNYLQHSPYLMTKSIIKKIWTTFPEHMSALSKSRFRDHNDFIIEWLHNFIAVHEGRGVPTLDASYKYIDVTQWRAFGDLISVLAIRRHKFFCINDNADNTNSVPRDRMAKRIMRFLNYLA